MTKNSLYASCVDGFPVRNDGSLVYNEAIESYSLDLTHSYQLAISILNCVNSKDYGAIVDDRNKKSGFSWAKDNKFVQENKGFCDFYDINAIAELLKSVANYGEVRKCDINYNSHRTNRTEINPSSKKTRLIFVMDLRANKNRLGKDLYVKIDFTETKTGLKVHLDSLHYFYGI